MNTLKFGNGEWYGKKDTILAYNDENSNFKPLPFSFDRASSATVVNKDGLIETVGSGEPRIDYKDDSKGALLLEPSRSNLIQYSEDFSSTYYNAGALTISSNASVSPEGVLNADKITEDATNNNHYKRRLFNVSGEFTMSIFVKKAEKDKIWLGNISTSQYSIFDLTNESSINFGTTSSKIENYGNGWYRCSIVDTLNQTAFLSFGLVDDNNNINYQGDGVSGLYAWGFQYEANSSYATSYIPTSGGAVTRNQDVCSQTVPSGIIGQTEGTVLFDYTPYDVSTSTSVDTIPLAISNNGSSGNAIFLNDYNGNLDLNVNLGGVNQAKIQFSSLANNQRFKIGIGYAVNDLVLYVNGVQIGIDTSLSLPTCNQIKLNGFTSNVHINRINVNDVKLYNTRLSNAELQALTTL